MKVETNKIVVEIADKFMVNDCGVEFSVYFSKKYEGVETYGNKKSFKIRVNNRGEFEIVDPKDLGEIIYSANHLRRVLSNCPLTDKDIREMRKEGFQIGR